MAKPSHIDRREFLRAASAAGVSLAMTNRFPSPALLSHRSPNERVRVAVMGLNSRGMVHAQNFARLANTEVAYLCDVDANVLAKAQAAMRQQQQGPSSAPMAVGDFRRALDDKEV